MDRYLDIFWDNPNHPPIKARETANPKHMPRKKKGSQISFTPFNYGEHFSLPFSLVL